MVQQAAQGRGYALSGFFLLAAVNCLYEICVPEAGGAYEALAGNGREHGKDGQEHEKDGQEHEKGRPEHEKGGQKDEDLSLIHI